MKVSREFLDACSASALSALLFATGVLLPLPGPLVGFFAAAPLIRVAALRGRVAGVLGGLLATALLLPVLPPPVALIFALEHAAPAWFLGWRIRRGRGIVAGSAAAALLVTVLVTGAAHLLSDRGQDPVQLFEQQLRQGLAELGTASGDGSSAADLAALSASLDQILALVRRVLPAMTLIGIFLEFSLNSLLAVRLPVRAAPPLPAPVLNAFALPEWVIWVLIPVLALCWAPQSTVATVALNALLPLLLGYLLQGLSITLHLADRARISRFSRTLFACSLIFLPWLLAVPLLLGLLDFRFGFRQRWPLT